ncbi:hypothetical protein V8F20_004831 [Naviculisporaceae sp. PSN 640]
MNRFRTKRRAKDDSAAGRSSEDSEAAPPKSSFTFRRGKKTQVEEPKKEIDLATALPSTDDFRTSLLMTNLSARFSMLREQDDPNTKIGKASDDSVLFPKRQSRMADFGYGAGLGLSDIAEVESIKAPFMRTDSLASDDASSTKSGSIMSRPKPAEGNNLFGGRQKVYKIPAGSSGGLGGRALYDDDVPLSSFQRWRLAEKEKAYAQEEQDDSAGDGDAEPSRSDSPPPAGYNQKRETSSTTSSGSLRARNSTAATSVISQPTASIKDSQSVSTAPTSTSSTPAVERSVTRTRRLYEQSSSQDQEPPSVMSRIDAFNRPRPFGSRTPDLGNTNTPSPTNSLFADRLIDKRSILTKASAPNLRSASPPTTGSSMGIMDLGIRVPAQADPKHTFGGAPPLSPPISEIGENPILPIQPSDIGKATALGVFHKPNQPYDESIYAQRQIQLQQGRETPTRRLRTESNASHGTDRSRSASSTHRQPFESRLEPIKTQPSVQEEPHQTSFLHDLDSPESATDGKLSLPVIPPVSLQRPADAEHPALRQSALPTPLSFTLGASNEPSPISDAAPSISVKKSEQPTPDPSPTIGQNAGLSGMVRQHLRSESNASSIYGAEPSAPGYSSQYALDSPEPRQNLADDLLAKSNPWMSPENEWTMSFYGDGMKRDLSSRNEASVPGSKPLDNAGNDVDNESDEFANQLADARRRVRERLTSYVESDSSRPASPSPRLEPVKDNGIPVPSNPLGVSVIKPKTSRGSLVDRSRSIVAGQSKAMKMLGLGSSSRGNSPGPARSSPDEKDITPLETMEEIPKEEEPQEREDANAHPGLKAFRQARRELQRRKELEKLAQQQLSQTMQHHDQPGDQPMVMQSASNEGVRQRTPSRERKPPPVLYRQRAPSDERSYGRNAPNSPSAHASSENSENERSGSQTRSGRSPPSNRPPRLRNNTGPQDAQLGPHNAARPPMLRSPGLPGTDIKRSPIMPPQPYPGRGLASPVPSPHVLDRSRSATNLAIHSGRPGYEQAGGQPSPISPLPGAVGLPPSPYLGSPAGTPTTLGPRPRKPSAPQSPAFPTTTSTLNESLKRVVDKRDISEPTFVMSTSRVPTVNLPQSQDGGSESRSRSSSRGNTGAAPPVPPINPRRRRPEAGYDDELSAPHLPFAGQTNSMTSEYSDDNRSAFSVSDDEDSKGDGRRRLRKNNGDGQTFGGRMLGKMRDNSPPFVAKGPPAARTVVSGNGPKVNHGANLPGGMF